MPKVGEVCRTGIYCWINLVNGKLYVGSAARSLSGRKLAHENMLREGKHANRYLQNAWTKYGEDRFDFIVLERCNSDKCLTRETYWIAKLDSANPERGYNICKEGRSRKGVKTPLETIAKQKASRAWYKPTEATKALWSTQRTGKLSEKQRIAVRKAQRAWKGSSHSEKAKQAIAAASLGRRHSEETKKKLSEASKGNKNASGKRSEEACERMRQTSLKRVSRGGNTMSLLSNLKGTNITKPKVANRPVWKGPEIDGITFSMLSRFLCCRERFRVFVVEGLKPVDSFNHRIEYGNLWHKAEEAHAATAPTRCPGWQEALLNYCQGLARKYPTQQQQVDHWYNVCRVQFPVYIEWWVKHPDVINRRPLLQEQVFDVPYQLPSGRTVRLRGKWDSVDLVGQGENAGIYLQENKTKGDINENQMRRQLASGFDLQTQLYLVALQLAQSRSLERLLATVPILGVRYNVVRRPLSGGKGSIVQHKPTKSNPRGELSAEYYSRLGGIIKEDPAYFFMRWKIEVSPADVARFRRECLDPILENLCNWWETVRPNGVWTQVEQDAAAANQNWRHPFGTWNPMDHGADSELDNYLASGSEIGLQRVSSLFPELQ